MTNYQDFEYDGDEGLGPDTFAFYKVPSVAEVRNFLNYLRGAADMEEPL